MNNALKLLTLVAILAVFGLTGCSDQAVTNPTTPETNTEASSVEADRFAGLTIDEIFAELETLVEPRDQQIILEGESFEQVMDRLVDYGVVTEAGGHEKSTLPSVLQMASVAAGAIASVNDGTYFDPLTTFRDLDNGDNAGFSVGWLVPHPDGIEGHFYCNVYVDRPLVWPANTVEVAPYSPPINEGAVRQANALWNPETIIRSSFSSDKYVVYNYVYVYQSDIGDRVGQMLKFALSQ